MTNRLIKISLFSIYILSAIGMFFYLLFPSAAVERYVASWVERSYPGIRLSLSRLHPNLPFGFSIGSSLLLLQDVPLFRADAIQLNPRLGSLLGPLKQIAFRGNTSGGRFNGTIRFAKGDPAVQIHVDTGLTGVKIEEVPFFQQLNIGGLSGVCEGRIQSGPDGSVTVEVKLSDCKGALPSSIAGADSILGAGSISLQRVQASLDYKKGNVEIRETVFQGPQINGSVSGVVIVREPLGKSLLRLSGKMSTDLRLTAGSDERAHMQMLSEKNPPAADVDFKIEGTLEDPALSFPGLS